MTEMHSDIGRSCSTSEWLRIKSFIWLGCQILFEPSVAVGLVTLADYFLASDCKSPTISAGFHSLPRYSLKTFPSGLITTVRSEWIT